jgi:hypothetical protein
VSIFGRELTCSYPETEHLHGYFPTTYEFSEQPI